MIFLILRSENETSKDGMIHPSDLSVALQGMEEMMALVEDSPMTDGKSLDARVRHGGAPARLPLIDKMGQPLRQLRPIR